MYVRPHVYVHMFHQVVLNCYVQTLDKNGINTYYKILNKWLEPITKSTNTLLLWNKLTSVSSMYVNNNSQ